MLPNLQEATQEYWHELDKLEIAYQQGEISIEEVNLEVASLMKELGMKRREAIKFFLHSFRLWLNQQKETLIALTLLVIISYLWILSHSI